MSSKTFIINKFIAFVYVVLSIIAMPIYKGYLVMVLASCMLVFWYDTLSTIGIDDFSFWFHVYLLDNAAVCCFLVSLFLITIQPIFFM